jgi:hypothetical protein
VVDPGLAGGLRAWLEDGAADAVADRPLDVPPVVIGRRSLAPVDPNPGQPADETLALLRRPLVRALFRQIVVTGRVGDPLSDALDAVSCVNRTAGITTAVDGLPASDRRRLRQEVAAHARTILRDWGPVPESWLPRTSDRVAVPLAGGRAVLAGCIDLVLGSPPAERGSVCLVDLRTGVRHPEDTVARHFHALLETIRTGAAPFRIATYYSATGELDVEEASDDALAQAVRRTVQALSRRVGASPGAPGEAGS